MMKIAVLSDTHGNVDLAVNALKKAGKLDLFIHLGDHYEDAIEIGKKLGVSVEAVAGNTDIHRAPTAPREKTIHVAGIKIFMTHGDLYKVTYGIDRLLEKAVEENVQAALYGHTHVSGIRKIGGILFLNPGCMLSHNGNNSFALLKIVDGIVEGEIVPAGN